ncbi:MAG TPA: hypothetical protein VLT59_10340 [Steroidobacteraceae bacterium]|nr:hypothetical protein [Steroidobacteraceae bacterium]
MRTSVTLALAVLALAVSGCTTLGKRIGEPIPDVADRFTVEQTDVRDVIAALGPPTRMSALQNGMVMTYEYLDATERQIGINLDFVALDFLKIAVGRGNARREVLALTFDRAGTMTAGSLRRWTDDIGRGGAVQLFFVAMPTVDSSDLRAPAEQHGWGRRLLREPPRTLNAGQDIASGQHGVELLGTPDGAGQRTLESQWKSRRDR